MKRICTICARGGSKGVPNKNLRIIAGLPLIAHSINQAVAANLFEKIVISTDSDEIREIALQFGAEAFFKRPEHLATDHAAKIPVIIHALQESERYFATQFDYVFDLDATSPLRSIEDIRKCAEMIELGKYGNIITATPARRSPYFNLVEINHQNQINISKPVNPPILRRQDAPSCFDMNASIYVWQRRALLEKVGLFHQDTGLYVMPEERSWDIDSGFDFEIVEYFLLKKMKNAG